MDPNIRVARAAVAIRKAASAVNEASERAYEADRHQIASQLLDLLGELFYLQRQVVELPAQRTPAACEFERGDYFENPEVPF